MNIITGSAGGLGQMVYKEFIKNNKKVLGIDIKESETTDLQLDLSESKNLEFALEKIYEEVDSITFCHALGNSKSNIINFDSEKYKYVNAESNFFFLDLVFNKFSIEPTVVFISSIHSQLTNSQSGNYALSKLYLEGLFRQYCLDQKYKKISKLLIRLGAMETPMLLDNINDLNKLKNNLPSKNILDPVKISKFIFNFHNTYKKDFDCSILNIDNGVSFQLSTD